MAIPRASWAKSGVDGLPAPFEKRVVTRTGPPCMWAARVSRDASGVGVNMPLHTVPFACTARWPSWRP